MSRLIICSNKNDYDELTRLSEEAGFEKNGATEDEKILLATFSKLNFKSQNFLYCGNGFVACSGTLIYKKKTSFEALKAIFDDFKGNVSSIRKNMVGSYVIAIKKNGQTVVFVDEVGTYAYHYYLDEETFVGCNNYYHIQKIIKSVIDKESVIERIIEFCNYDNTTPFKNIFRLLGNEAIIINGDEINVLKIPVNTYSFDLSDKDSVLDTFLSLVEKYASKFKLLSGNGILFTTGGVDSRINLAIYEHLGIKIVVGNWQGCPDDMNSKTEDALIAEKLADVTTNEFKLFNVEHNYEDDIKNIYCKLNKYGEYGLIYCGNTKWYEIFENSDYQVYDFGYFGETIKGWELIDEDYHLNYTIDDFAKLYLNRQQYKYQDNTFYAYVKSKLQAAAESFGMDLLHLSKEDCMILYYVYRIHADTCCSNLANMFGYSYNLFAEKEIADFINQIPYEYKKANHLNLLATFKLEEKLVYIPYFTHRHYMSFDVENMCLRNNQATKNNFKKWILSKRTGKILVKIKMFFSHRKDPIKDASLRFLFQYEFQKKSNLLIDKDAFSEKVIFYELPGWACMFDDLL